MDEETKFAIDGIQTAIKALANQQEELTKKVKKLFFCLCLEWEGPT